MSPVQVESPKSILMSALAERGYTENEQLRLLSGVQDMVRQGGQNPQMPTYCQPGWRDDMMALYNRWQQVAPEVRSVDALGADTAKKLLRGDLGESVFGRVSAVPEVSERGTTMTFAEQAPSYAPSREQWRSMIPRPREQETSGGVSQERPEQQAAPQTTYQYAVEMQGRQFTFETTHNLGERTTLADVRQLYDKDPSAFTRITTGGAEQPRGVFAVFLRAADDEATRQGKSISISRAPGTARVFTYQAEFIGEDNQRYVFSFGTNRGFELNTIHDLNRALELFGGSFVSMEAHVYNAAGEEAMSFDTPQQMVSTLASASIRRPGSVRGSIELTYMPPTQTVAAGREEKEAPAVAEAPVRTQTYMFETPSQRFVFTTSAPLESLTMDGLLKALRPGSGIEVAVNEIYLAGAATPITLRRQTELEARLTREEARQLVERYVSMVAGLVREGSPVPVTISQVIS